MSFRFGLCRDGCSAYSEDAFRTCQATIGAAVIIHIIFPWGPFINTLYNTPKTLF